jgi:hypothetical protein
VSWHAPSVILLYLISIMLCVNMTKASVIETYSVTHTKVPIWFLKDPWPTETTIPCDISLKTCFALPVICWNLHCVFHGCASTRSLRTTASIGLLHCCVVVLDIYHPQCSIKNVDHHKYIIVDYGRVCGSRHGRVVMIWSVTKSSLTGNLILVSRVTGEDTIHYTIKEVTVLFLQLQLLLVPCLVQGVDNSISLRDILILHNCKSFCNLIQSIYFTIISNKSMLPIR